MDGSTAHAEEDAEVPAGPSWLRRATICTYVVAFYLSPKLVNRPFVSGCPGHFGLLRDALDVTAYEWPSTNATHWSETGMQLQQSKDRQEWTVSLNKRDRSFARDRLIAKLSMALCISRNTQLSLCLSSPASDGC